MVTVDEFAIILRDSPLSVSVVEFSGPQSENVVVKLVDGTTFGIKDIVEAFHFIILDKCAPFYTV